MKALQQQRYFYIRSLERKRGSRVIVLIHRQEEMSFFGFPIARYINIEDSEKILRAIHLTNKNIPIDLILHTPGGIVLAAEQIARAIKKHPAKVTVFIPHYSMSGGSLIALAADEVVMDPNAVIGPVDPQIGTMHSQYPAASVLRALEIPNPNRDDETLILGDIARKAINQVYQVVYDLVKDKVEEEKAKKLADILSTGDHYIQEIKIKLNGKDMVLQYFLTQSSSGVQEAQYLFIDAKSGDTIEVYALCNKFGDKTITLNID
jgi:ClpP class serine protease